MEGRKTRHKKAGNKFLFFLLFIFIIFNSVNISNSYSLYIPYPPNTELINGGTHQHRSLLTQDKILKFYQQRLTREGWRQVDVPSQQVSGFDSLNRTFNFVKGSDTLILTFSPFTAEGFVFYTIDTGVPPEAGDLAETEELPLDNVFKEPESLDFMPIFPGSKQVDYRKTSLGIHICYIANKEVEGVKGFYLQGMPEYGWSLVNQEPMDGKEYNLSEIDSACPTCPKLPLEIKGIMANIEVTGVILEFKQKGKVCSVTVSKTGNLSSPEARGLTSLGLGDTIITVFYNEKK